MKNLREDLFEKARKWAILKNENHPWKNMSNEEIVRSSGLYREDVMTHPLVKVLKEMQVKDVDKMMIKEFNVALIGTKAQDKAQDEVTMKIIEFCKQERNIFEIMNYIGYKNRTRFRRDYIKPLVEKGILKKALDKFNEGKPVELKEIEESNRKYDKNII